MGLSNAQWNLGRIVGPSLAGVAIAIGGIGTALWCNAISFLAVIVCVLIVRIGPSGGERRPVVRALLDGLHFARTNADMRRMVPLMIITILVGAPFIAFVSQMATVVFHGDEKSTSVLVAAQGVGAVAGAFTLGWSTSRFGIWRVMFVSIAVFAAALVWYGSAPALWVAAIGLPAAGSATATRSPRSPASARAGRRGHARPGAGGEHVHPRSAVPDRRAVPGMARRPDRAEVGDGRFGWVLFAGLLWRVALISRRRVPAPGCTTTASRTAART